jgi:hypothetical protein
MNLRQRMILTRWTRRVRSVLPVVFGVAIGAAAFAVFDQTYGPAEPPARLTAMQQSPVQPFANCDAARAADAAPLYRGEPGYAPHLDADRDGVACEPYPR